MSICISPLEASGVSDTFPSEFSLSCGVRSGDRVIIRVVESVQLSELEEVLPKRGMLTSSLRIVTHDGRKMKYHDLLKSAAHGISDNIRDSLQQQLYR